MKRRTRSDWQALIQQQSESGLLASEFCRQHNVCPKYFSKRKSDLKQKPKQKNEKAFVKVQRPVPPSIPDIVQIKYHHAIMRVPTSVTPDWLANLLKALA